MIKYKLYTFSGAMYVVPLYKCEYVGNTVGRYFKDYCAGLLTSHELDRLVEECIIDNGGKCFDMLCDDYYVILNDGENNLGKSFDDVLEVPLIGQRKTAQYG